jgi:hypothetical protein
MNSCENSETHKDITTNNVTKTWSNGIAHERSPRRPRSENAREYINPVARALNDNETWTVDDQGLFHPTIPYTIKN